jgi:hypothetical protein
MINEECDFQARGTVKSDKVLPTIWKVLSPSFGVKKLENQTANKQRGTRIETWFRYKPGN